MDMMEYFIKQNKETEDLPDLMTDTSTPENDSEVSTVDSIFGIPRSREQNSSWSSKSSLNEDDSTATCSTTSSESSSLLGPPPPGSLLELWDIPFTNEPLFFPAGTALISDTTSLDMEDSSIDSMDSDEIQTPVVRHVIATTKVVDLTDGELVDSGGNFCMCNNLSMMVNIRPITPFGINMAATQDKTAPMCTHRGYFPIPMTDGTTHYTPMYYNAQASDCILSPHAICRDSGGFLTRWIQEGTTTASNGTVTFYNRGDEAIIRLHLVEKNGLFYTRTETTYQTGRTIHWK